MYAQLTPTHARTHAHTHIHSRRDDCHSYTVHSFTAYRLGYNKGIVTSNSYVTAASDVSKLNYNNPLVQSAQGRSDLSQAGVT